MSHLNQALRTFSAQERLPLRDIRMLARIHFRAVQPSTPDAYWYIYQAIKRTVLADASPDTDHAEHRP